MQVPTPKSKFSNPDRELTDSICSVSFDMIDYCKMRSISTGSAQDSKISRVPTHLFVLMAPCLRQTRKSK
eukprot:589344-Karenia_brevis.AAC.1